MDISKFPTLFKMDHFSNCIRNKQTFCMVDAKLSKGFRYSSIWRDIMKSSNDEHRLDRSYLHRGLCLPPDNSEILAKSVTDELSNEISEYNLTANVHLMYCQDSVITIAAIDVIFALIISAIVLAFIIGTAMDTKDIKANNTLGKILLKFSVKENWKKIIRTTGDEDFTRLKSIQGLRVLCMFGTLSIHACIKLIANYYNNPEILEAMLTEYLPESLIVLFTFTVHIFLMISAFLLANQVYDHYDKNGSFTFRDVVVLIGNRYLRLYVPTLFLIIMSISSLFQPFLGVPLVKFYKMNKYGCENSWPSTFFFGMNFMPFIEQCNPTVWYLSADFQAYVLISLILYIILKNQLNPLKVMMNVLVASILVYAIYIFVRNPKYIVFKAHVNTIERFLLSPIEDYITVYSSTISTLPTSFTGMIFGYIYFKTTKYNIELKSMVYEAAFYVIFYGSQVFCVYLAMQDYNRVVTAILGSVIKVIFSAGVACGIIAMSLGIGGALKRIFEWKYFTILSNITFSSYLCNYTMILSSGMGMSELATFSFSYMIHDFLSQFIASIGFGLIIGLVLEQPVLSLQKMFLPQLKRTKNEQVKEK